MKPGGMHQKFFASRKKIQVIGGGFGNGKTAASVVKALTLADQYPGSNGLIGMATYSQLNDTIRKELFKWVPKSKVARWPTINDNTMHLTNGSVINFRYIKQKGKAAAADGHTSSNLLSATYDWAVIDQIENPEITYKDFRDLLGRLRGTTPYKGNDPTMPETGPRWLILAANPSYNWFYQKIIKPYNIWKETGAVTEGLPYDSETGEVLMDLFEASTYENAHNLPADFITGMEATYKGQFRDRYLGGEWGAFDGLVYPEFSRKMHMVPKNEILQYLYKLGHSNLAPEMLSGFDFGIVSPSCYLIGFVDYRGRIFVVDGFYKRNMPLPEIGAHMRVLMLTYLPFFQSETAVLADPAIFKRTPTAGMGTGTDTIVDFLSTNYGMTFRPGHNDILNGIAKVSTYLSLNDFPYFNDTRKTGPVIFFADHLSFIAEEFASYFWKMGTNEERTDSPIDKNDHAMDTLKYMLSYLPSAKELLTNYSETLKGDVRWLK